MELLERDNRIAAPEGRQDAAGFSLEDILAEFADDRLGVPPCSELDARSHRIVLEALDETLGAAQVTSAAAAGTEGLPAAPPPPDPVLDAADADFDADFDVAADFDEDLRLYGPAPDADADVKLYSPGRAAAGSAAPYIAPEAGRAPGADADAYTDAGGYTDAEAGGGAEYAGAGWAAEGPRRAPEGARRGPGRGLGRSLKAPFLSFLALVGLRLQTIRRAGAAPAHEDEEELGPEMPAAEAAKYYGGHLRSLRLRLLLSLLPAAALLWLSFGLPAFGALGADLRVRSLVCLILQLTLMLLALDVCTAGLMSLARGRPGLWSLAAFSCVAAALDAAVTAAAGDSGWGLPFCGAAGLGLVFALWGAELTSGGLRLSLKALELAKTPYIVTAEAGVTEAGPALLRARRETEGFLRRCEEPDAAESLWAQLAPFLLFAALILAVLATAISGEWTRFFRILAAITAPAAPLGAFLACPLPMALAAARLFRAGAAAAGWAGLRDIGRAARLVVTDSDLFPATTVSIDAIRILEGVPPAKAIAAAGSMVCASGSGLAPVFLELMRRNGCTMQRVEDFACHEGGGLTALINGERVACGSAGFMHLIGVHLPRRLASGEAVYLAVGEELNAIFTVGYVPVTSVQDALAQLLRSRRRPVFAIRDFLVTPLMLRQKFRLPTEGFDFPSFARRYEISAAQPGLDSQVSALLSREGLGSLVEVADCGRRAYLAAGLTVALSAVCALVGMAFMFWLCASGALAAVTVGRMLTYLLLWLVPLLVGVLGLLR